MLVLIAYSIVTLAADSASPSDPLSPIALYQGTWRAQGQRFDTEFSKAGRSSRTLRNDCWRAGLFYACAQTVEGRQVALVAYFWDAAAGAYAAYSIPADGGPAGKGRLVIDGDTWTFPWDKQAAGATVHLRVVNHFVGRDRIEYRREFSRDGVRWTLMETGVEDRQAG